MCVRAERLRGRGDACMSARGTVFSGSSDAYNRFMGRYLRHGEGYPDWSLRLFDRRHARWSQDVIHEKVLADGPVGTLTLVTTEASGRRSMLKPGPSRGDP